MIWIRHAYGRNGMNESEEKDDEKRATKEKGARRSDKASSSTNESIKKNEK